MGRDDTEAGDMESIYLVIAVAFTFGVALSLLHAHICRKAIARYESGGRC
jgi:hypothetical protein